MASEESAIRVIEPNLDKYGRQKRRSRDCDRQGGTDDAIDFLYRNTRLFETLNRCIASAYATAVRNEVHHYDKEWTL
jgi:hypothetical protein